MATRGKGLAQTWSPSKALPLASTAHMMRVLLFASTTAAFCTFRMPQEPDDEFYNRADGHIQLANEQLKGMSAGKVSASFMFAASRFNAWCSATGFNSQAEMRADRAKTIAYFVAEYEKCLVENLDDYIENFDSYMRQQQ